MDVFSVVFCYDLRHSDSSLKNTFTYYESIPYLSLSENSVLAMILCCLLLTSSERSRILNRTDIAWLGNIDIPSIELFIEQLRVLLSIYFSDF